MMPQKESKLYEVIDYSFFFPYCFSMKKLDDLTKAKLIYSGELVLFAIVFLVLGLLTMFGVIEVTERRITILTWLTLVGGTLAIGNSIWFFASEKKRKKGSMLDTVLLLPVPLCMIPIDIIHLVNQAIPNDMYKYIIGSTFLYIVVIYVIEAIYHWYKPLPLLLEAAEEEKQKEEQENAEAENKTEETEETKEE